MVTEGEVPGDGIEDMGEREEIVPITDFEVNPDCPKCIGSKEDLLFLFCEGPIKGQLCKSLPEDYEHLHVECSTCGYRYLMETRDAEERKAAKEEEKPAEVGKDVQFESD